MDGLNGKVAIVAAASRGLGLASATALARRGVNVTIFSRSRDALSEASEQIRAQGTGKVHYVVANLKNPEDLEGVVNETVELFGSVDILVNNSGGPPIGTFMAVSEEDWRRAFDIEVMSVVRLCRLVIPVMKERGGGRIINIATVGVKKPQPGLVLSDATRHCIVGLALNLAVEFAPDNILVNTVCPGPIMTQRLEDAIQKTADRRGISMEKAKEHWLNLIPIHEFGEPKDLGELVAYLASGRGKFITGTVTQVDGGKAII